MVDVLQIANKLNQIYDTSLTNDLVKALTPDALLVDVLLLCTECQQPIKARVNTNNWIRVEWIGPEGECQACNKLKREGESQ